MPRLAYFADDFTGATDALESLARAGLRTRLFLDPPSAEQCTGLDAIGVAGLTRSLASDAMEAVLRPAFTQLRELGPRHVHYKVCSTFDSSPTVGSIGRAIDVGASVFGGKIVPLLVAAPALGRFCAFGNLFARYGIGSGGYIHRLDRHPSVSHHPITPMTEAELRVHLGKQTAKSIGLVDVLDLERSTEDCAAVLEKIVNGGHEVVLFDSINTAHLTRVGALIDGLAGTAPLFSVGSSGVGAALTAHWGATNRSYPSAEQSPSPILALSGSCSPVTGGQIGWARANGFEGFALSLVAEDFSSALEPMVKALRSGKNVVAYTSLGHTRSHLPADRLGTMLGRLARETIDRAGVKRAVVAGGDTSSYAGRALGIESLEMLSPLVPGAPLCRCSAPGSPADGMEIVFKGGQVGSADFFGAVARGAL